jgi:hypothetical protein
MYFGLLLAVLFGASPIFAQQPAPGEPAPLQAGMSNLANDLRSNPRLKKLSQQQRENLVEFVIGNTLFVLLHEMGHATVQELRIPVLGREEDTADNFAILRMLKVGTEMSHRILVEATRGWFLSDLRDRRDGESLVFYDEHSLDKQRAYQIVCLMFGSAPKQMADLAKMTKLPPERQDTCQDDYENVSWSWETVLKTYQRSEEQPKTKIDVVYGDGKVDLASYAQGFRSVRLLEMVAERAAEEFKWPTPFTLEMQSCGVVNAHWVQSARKLTVCYELAQDFAELYRNFNDKLLADSKVKRKSK